MWELTQSTIEKWIESIRGEFYLKNMWNELNIGFDRDKKAHLRVIMHRLCKKGVIKLTGKRDGSYRVIDKCAPEVNWRGAKKRVVLLELPFELEKFVRILPGTLIVIAGSVGAGKTAFLYNTIYLNMYNFKMVLFTNDEMTNLQIEERFDAIDPDIPNPIPFVIKRRNDDFADVIEPNAINLVDYLNMDKDLFMIGSKLRNIHAELNEGVAIVAIQKPKGRELGYGATFSLMSASVYLSMDKGRLKIIKARERARSEVDPINKAWLFHLDNRGARFLNIRDVK